LVFEPIDRLLRGSPTESRLEAVSKADESGPFAKVGSPDSVVSDVEERVRAFGIIAHLHLGGVRMLGRIRQSF
jgi:hypothetical protein